MSPRPAWPADRAATRRVRAAIDADRPVAPQDRAVAGQVLARMCWSPVRLVLFVMASVFLIVEPWIWHTSGTAIALRLGWFLLCAWLLFGQLKLRRWRRRHLDAAARMSALSQRSSEDGR